jgi:hypothetical protein
VGKGEGSKEGGGDEGRTGWRGYWEALCIAATSVALDKCG